MDLRLVRAGAAGHARVAAFTRGDRDSCATGWNYLATIELRDLRGQAVCGIGGGGTRLLARRGSNIRTLAGLRGRRVAVNPRNGQDIMPIHALRGDVDAAAILESSASLILAQQGATMVRNLAQEGFGTSHGGMHVRDDFVRDQPAAAEAIVAATVKAIDFGNANEEAHVQRTMQVTGQTRGLATLAVENVSPAWRMPMATIRAICKAVHELGQEVGHVTRRFPPETLKPGDGIAANDPYVGGGSHLPDLTLAGPVFAAGRAIGFVCNIAHHSGVGGKVPGSESADCTSIFREGLRIAPVKLVAEGVPRQDIAGILLRTSRTPQEREGDLKAQVATSATGVRRMEEPVAQPGTLFNAMPPAAEVTWFGHGTTVATNAMIQGRLAPTGLVTTDGFRDRLEIRRQRQPHDRNIRIPKPRPPVPRRLRFEVPERVFLTAREPIAPQRADLEPAIAAFRAAGVEAVAICFPHARHDPSHARLVAGWLRGALAGAVICPPHPILAEFREDGRLSTTVLHAGLGPVMSRHLARLEERRLALGLGAAPHTLQSNGGVASAREAGEKPVRMLASGPAAGVTGAIQAGGAAGFPDLVTFDVGGTSRDLCLVQAGRPAIARGKACRGWPVRLPMMDVPYPGQSLRCDASGNLIISVRG